MLLNVACAGDVPDTAPTAAQGADTSIVLRALDTAMYQWHRVETSRATLYAAVSVSPHAIAQIADSVDGIIASHLTWLGAAEMGSKLRLFFVGSRDEIEPITGSRAPAWSEPGSGSAFFVVTDSARTALRHETMHLLSWREWGVPSAFWMSEGVATAAVPLCGGLSTGAVVSMLDRAGMLLPLETLRSNFSFAGDTGFVFYLQSADLVQFIDRTFGREKLRTVWSGDGLAGVRETLGVDRWTLERDWRAAVSAAPAPVAWLGWPAWRAELDRHGCS